MTTVKLDSLRQLDLDERQVRVYRALLDLGPASIRDVAAKAGINRGTTYETLKQLATKGIVSYFPKGRRRVFQAEDPERLFSGPDPQGRLGDRRQHDALFVGIVHHAHGTACECGGRVAGQVEHGRSGDAGLEQASDGIGRAGTSAGDQNPKRGLFDQVMKNRAVGLVKMGRDIHAASCRWR